MSNTGKKELGTGNETPCSSNGFIKSSAYAPVSLNLMGMYLVKEHMNAHYKKIYNVKAAVDTRPPHSMQNRIKSAGGASRIHSRCSSRQSYAKSPHYHQDGIDETRGNMHLMDKIDKYLESVQDDPSPPPTSSKNYNRNSSSQTIRERSRNIKSRVKFGYESQLPERYRDYFTRSRDLFQRISSSHKETAPNRKYSASSKYSNHEKRVVPALRIQRDLDHARWLKDQARKLRAEQKLNELEHSFETERSDDLVDNFDTANGRFNSTNEQDTDLSNINDEVDYEDYVNLNSPFESVTSPKNREMLAPLKTIRINSPKPYSSMRSMVKEQLEAEEEELRYLEFITDVTNDILLRGVYTDRALKQVFQYHMNKRNDLDFNKMKNLLGKLQDDLGIPRFEKQFPSTLLDPISNEKKNYILHNPTTEKSEMVKNKVSLDKLESPLHSNSQKSMGNKKTTLVHFSPRLEQQIEREKEKQLDTDVGEIEIKDGGDQDAGDKESELSHHLEGVDLSTNDETSEEESFENDLEVDYNELSPKSLLSKEDKEVKSIMSYSDEDFCSSSSEK